jgi:DNA-binding protein H-NS
MKNRANVYKLQWDLGKKTEVIGTFTVKMQDRLTNTPRKFKHKKGRMDHCGWMWTGQPKYGQI